MWEKDGYTMRLAVKEDAEAYYSCNFNPLDPEVVRLTGCKAEFTHDEVVDFFCRCIESKDRYDFMIAAPDGQIIGESVINEIDELTKSANFRIALFHEEGCGKGIGSWAIRQTMRYADDILMSILETEWRELYTGNARGDA